LLQHDSMVKRGIISRQEMETCILYLGHFTVRMRWSITTMSYDSWIT